MLRRCGHANTDRSQVGCVVPMYYVCALWAFFVPLWMTLLPELPGQGTSIFCQLELPFCCRNTAKTGTGRTKLFSSSGKSSLSIMYIFEDSGSTRHGESFAVSHYVHYVHLSHYVSQQKQGTNNIALLHGQTENSESNSST